MACLGSEGPLKIQDDILLGMLSACTSNFSCFKNIKYLTLDINLLGGWTATDLASFLLTITLGYRQWTLCCSDVDHTQWVSSSDFVQNALFMCCY